MVFLGSPTATLYIKNLSSKCAENDLVSAHSVEVGRLQPITTQLVRIAGPLSQVLAPAVLSMGCGADSVVSVLPSPGCSSALQTLQEGQNEGPGDI